MPKRKMNSLTLLFTNESAIMRPMRDELGHIEDDHKTAAGPLDHLLVEKKAVAALSGRRCAARDARTPQQVFLAES